MNLATVNLKGQDLIVLALTDQELEETGSFSKEDRHKLAAEKERRSEARAEHQARMERQRYR